METFPTSYRFWAQGRRGIGKGIAGKGNSLYRKFLRDHELCHSNFVSSVI
jgi:hypothetical protein